MPCCDKESGSNFRQQQKHSKNFLIFAKKKVLTPNEPFIIFFRFMIAIQETSEGIICVHLALCYGVKLNM